MTQDYQDLRKAIRTLCAQFPPEYHRKVDTAQAYPEEYGGSGVGLTEASWEAANDCLQFHGGYGFADEYDVERKFRETRLYQVAPTSTNLILSDAAEHVLGLPRSF